MENSQHRHDMKDEIWAKLEPITSQWIWGGSNANDTRLFIDAVCWVLRTGAVARYAADLWKVFHYTQAIQALV